MPKIKINDREYEVPGGITMLQAARLVGVEIPVFCYHDRLAIAGNCRMCLVELDKAPKPVASCAMPVTEGMSFHTFSDKARKARKGVLELLLINHPLDCPICDQGGECDLQDITMAYGPSSSRFEENKRAVPDKPMGPLIRTFMNRCIHCTRCVRFMNDVAGVPEMGAVNRGENMEILSYLDQALTSELSANVVDLCPVGALTSKPYSFRGRPWELAKTDSIDVLDAVGSSIRIDSHNMQVMRILPRLNEEINEEWISDKSRYACDGLLRQRLDTPYVRNAEGYLEPASWPQAFQKIKAQIQQTDGNRIAAIAGDMADVESMVALRDLLKSLGSSHLECRQDGANIHPESRASYVFNTTIAGIEQADFCLIIGANLRREAPIIAARLRKRFLQKALKVAYIGGEIAPHQSLNFPYAELGNDPEILEAIYEGKHPLTHEMRSANNPMLILGQQPLARPDGMAIQALAINIAEKYGFIQEQWNGYNMLHTAAARVGALDIGFYPADMVRNLADLLNDIAQDKIDTVFLLGADEVDMTRLKKAFVIYQGHHGDKGAQIADVVLPGAAYTEKDATYVNTEGRPQHTFAAVNRPGNAQEDWRIIRALSEVLGHKLPYDTLEAIRAHMMSINPVFAHTGEVKSFKMGKLEKKGKLASEKFAPCETNFYMTDSISRNSLTMAKCIEEIEQPRLRKQVA